MLQIDEKIMTNLKCKESYIKIHHKETVEYYRQREDLKTTQSRGGVGYAD